MPELIQRVRELADPYDRCWLECDGMAHVLHAVLSEEGIAHDVFLGEIRMGEKAFSPHYWIALPGGYIVDYRARMWLGHEAPHGVFLLPEGVVYEGKRVWMPVLPRKVIDSVVEVFSPLDRREVLGR